MIQYCNKGKVLKLFLDNPLKGFKLREISRLINLGLPSVSRYVGELMQEEIVVKKEVESIPLIFANRENRIFKLEKIFENLRKIEKSEVLNYLEEKLDFPTIILFGSVAQGEDTEKSDMDICIITPSKNKLELKKFEKILGKETQTFIFSEKEFLKLKTNNTELFNNIINGRILRGLLKI